MKNKKILLSVAIILILLSVAGVFWYQKTHTEQQSRTEPATTPTINYSPPTSQEKAAANEQKTQNVENTKTGTTNQTTPANVKPFISYAGQTSSIIEVDAYVDSIAEDGGKCTMTATLGTETVTRTVNAVMNAKTTNCLPFNLDRNQFKTAGTWSTTVTYSSGTHNGTSDPVTMEIN